MNIRRIAALVWGLIVIVASNTILVMPNGIAVPTPVQSQREFTLSQQQIIDRLKTANVVYLGETHDRESDHQQQLAIIQALFQHQPQVAIGMEMFQRPAQPTIDRYLAGKITADELRQQTEFDTRWGFPWAYYEPILDFAKVNHLPVIALNTPTEITRKTGKQGLESLTGSDLWYIPPIAEIDFSNAQYRQLILASYQQHVGVVPIASKSFDRFHSAQLLWDETMADRIANFAKREPKYQTIVLVGQSHVTYGYGIPDRVRRRFKGSKFIAKTLLLSDNGDPNQQQSADFLWN
jgi:uncharacterized iron-regulated protein